MRTLTAWLMALAISFIATPLEAKERLNVVASFSILADFVREVGGERVEVTTLVGANGDVHVYTPAPQDVKKIADARLVFVNGLGLEGWLTRLLQSSPGKPSVVVVTNGITPLRLGSQADPHAWQSVENAKVYVKNIRDALVQADVADADYFRRNADRYLVELDALDRAVRNEVEKIPPERRKVISTHYAFGYFARSYGVEFIAPSGVSTEAEPSAGDVAAIITRIKRDEVPAVFLENISDDRLMRRISEETGAAVGGTLYSDSLTDEKGVAPTYIAMVNHNIRALTSALSR